MSELVVRSAPDARRTTVLTVETAGEVVARATVSRSRRALRYDPPDGPRPAPPQATLPDPQAWTASAASRAATSRWDDAHPAVGTIELLSHLDPTWSPAEIIAAVGAHLASAGIRRIDVRLAAGDPLAGSLVGPTWVQGRVGADIVASLAVAYPWHGLHDRARPVPAFAERLPPRLSRTARRIASTSVRQVPELIRSTATEAREAIRHRYAPGAPRALPTSGAPPGSHPFAASRYRTVRTALALVPGPLRAGSFVDIGCGDGRVLGEALDAGFARVHGRELDPELARRAAAVVGGAGHVEAGDALAVALPDDARVLFLNNPFDSRGLARFADLVAQTLQRSPRPLIVLYLNPRPVEPLLAARLVLVHVDPRYSVLTSGLRP